MGQYFGIKPDEEKYIWEVAEMALCAPLPPGWKEEVTQEPGEAAPGIAFRCVPFIIRCRHHSGASSCLLKRCEMTLGEAMLV
jgi:hypothetical protein